VNLLVVVTTFLAAMTLWKLARKYCGMYGADDRVKLYNVVHMKLSAFIQLVSTVLHKMSTNGKCNRELYVQLHKISATKRYTGKLASVGKTPYRRNCQRKLQHKRTKAMKRAIGPNIPVPLYGQYHAPMLNTNSGMWFIRIATFMSQIPRIECATSTMPDNTLATTTNPPYPNGEGMEQALALVILIGIAAMASVTMMHHGTARAPDVLSTDDQEYEQHEKRALLIANSKAANNWQRTIESMDGVGEPKPQGKWFRALHYGRNVPLTYDPCRCAASGNCQQHNGQLHQLPRYVHDQNGADCNVLAGLYPHTRWERIQHWEEDRVYITIVTAFDFLVEDLRELEPIPAIRLDELLTSLGVFFPLYLQLHGANDIDQNGYPPYANNHSVYFERYVRNTHERHRENMRNDSSYRLRVMSPLDQAACEVMYHIQALENALISLRHQQWTVATVLGYERPCAPVRNTSDSYNVVQDGAGGLRAFPHPENPFRILPYHLWWTQPIDQLPPARQMTDRALYLNPVRWDYVTHAVQGY